VSKLEAYNQVQDFVVLDVEQNLDAKLYTPLQLVDNYIPEKGGPSPLKKDKMKKAIPEPTKVESKASEK
jgi:hypothetical protein